MSTTLEAFFSEFTLDKLCEASGITIVDLLHRVGFGSDEAPESPRAAPKSNGSSRAPDFFMSTITKGPDVLGNLMAITERQKLEASIVKALRTAGPQTAGAIQTMLPWQNLTRDQLTKTLRRMGETGAVEISGPPQTRLYAIGPKAS
jgi:hypothetical protein